VGQVTERLTAVLDAKSGGLITEFNKSAAAASKLERTAVGANKNIGRSSALSGDAIRIGLGGAAAFAGVAVVKFALNAAHAASDMNESISKAKVVFGDGTDAVIKFGDGAAKSLGISKQEAIESTATFGNFFTALGIGQQKAEDMSIGIVKLAADLASFNNANPEDVLLALRSGLAGEVEPLRKFGVDLSEAALKTQALRLGLTKTTTQTLPAGIKAQAAYALIMQQTTTAQGDFARTAGGAANQGRILAAQFKDFTATVGTGTLPVLNLTVHTLNEIVGPLSALVKGIGDLPPGLRTAVVDLALLVGGLKLVKFAFGGLASSLGNKVIDKLSLDFSNLSLGTVQYAERASLAKRATASIGSGFKSLVGAIGPVNLALAAGAIVLGYYAQKHAEAKANVDAFTEAIKADGNALGKETRELTVNRLEKAGGLEAANKLGISLGDVTEAALGNADALRLVAEQAKGGGDAQFTLLAAIGNTHKEFIGGTAAAGREAGALKQGAASADLMSQAITNTGKSVLVAATHTNQFGEKVNSATGKVIEAKSAIEKLTFVLDVLNGKNVSVAESQIQWLDSLDALKVAVKDNGKGLDAFNPKARQVRTAFINATKSAQDFSEKVADKSGYEAGRTQLIASRAELVRLGTRLGLSKAAVQALLNQFLKVPPIKRTEFQINHAAAVAQAARIAAAIGKIHGKAVGIQVTQNNTVQRVQREIDNIHGKNIVVSVTTGGGPTRGGTERRSRGGEITGGTPGQDSVLALLTPGERVLTVAENRAWKLGLRVPGSGSSGVSVAPGAVQVTFNGPVHPGAVSDVRRVVEQAFDKLRNELVVGRRR
jgi:hypothetical protein